MPTEPHWLNAREDRAWRAFMHANHQLNTCLNQHLLQDSGLSGADYEILAVLSGLPEGRMPSQEMGTLLRWEKSRLSHQLRRMQERGLVAREPNPADGRSAMIVLLPAGRRAIEAAAPEHVRNVRRYMIDLFTPAELDTLAGLNERILRHLAGEPRPDKAARGSIHRRLQVPLIGPAADPGAPLIESSTVAISGALAPLIVLLSKGSFLEA